MPTRSQPAAAARVSPTAPKSASLSHSIWGYLESIPGLSKRVKKAERDIEAGRGISSKKYRANR